MFSILATDIEFTDNLSTGIPIETRELISFPKSNFALAALSACLLAFPVDELTATSVNLVSGCGHRNPCENVNPFECYLSQVAVLDPERLFYRRKGQMSFSIFPNSRKAILAESIARS